VGSRFNRQFGLSAGTVPVLPYPILIPPLAARAYRVAEETGFGADGGVSSSRPGVGALLAVLAAARPGGRMAELGTGLGAGAAWLLSGMDAAATLVTVELDADRAALARDLLATDPRATVITGGWEDHLPARAPFDLVFVDSGVSGRLDDEETAASVLELVGVGGQLVLDDLTPEAELHPPPAVDPKRAFALRHPRLVGAELYPPGTDGSVGGVRSGLLVATRVA